MTENSDILLGKETGYHFEYDASVLYPIPRSEGRKRLGMGEELPFAGKDLWTAYEFSWLNATGMPQVAIVEFLFPCTSPNMVESKSFKLYLNTFNQTRFASRDEVMATLQRDLSRVAEATVEVQMFAIADYPVATTSQFANEYTLIDGLAVASDIYLPEPALLQSVSRVVEAKLCSYLFRSLCPVTGQPDWASIYIHYTGHHIVEASLLQYLVSFRNHPGFHEQCVEQIFCDLVQHCAPEKLTVYARFLRRGGLDINPLRSSVSEEFPLLREPRQ